MKLVRYGNPGREQALRDRIAQAGGAAGHHRVAVVEIELVHSVMPPSTA